MGPIMTQPIAARRHRRNRGTRLRRAMHRACHSTHHSTCHKATFSTIFVIALFSRRNVRPAIEIGPIDNHESGGRKWFFAATGGDDRHGALREMVDAFRRVSYPASRPTLQLESLPMRHFWCLALLILPAFALAEDPPVRVRPEGQKSDDARLGPARTLNDYFPFTPPKSKQEWE